MNTPVLPITKVEDVQKGDTVTLSKETIHVEGPSQYSWASHRAVAVDIPGTGSVASTAEGWAFVSAVRKAPTAPAGTKGTATVRGKENTPIIRTAYNNSEWFSYAYTVNGFAFHRDGSHVVDFVPDPPEEAARDVLSKVLDRVNDHEEPLLSDLWDPNPVIRNSATLVRDLRTLLRDVEVS